jgi:hypothetical protein
VSRRRFKQGDRALVVGWDHPLLTFFAQDDNDEPIETGDLMLGFGVFKEFYDLEPFKEALAREDIALPDEVEVQLYMDRDLGL